MEKKKMKLQHEEKLLELDVRMSEAQVKLFEAENRKRESELKASSANND